MNRFRPKIAAKQTADGRKEPLSHEFIERWLEDEFILLCSLDAWYEIIEKLEEFEVPEALLRQLGSLLRDLTEPVEIVSNGCWCSDQDDDKWLRMGIDGDATHLVTADRRLHAAQGPFEFRRVRLWGFISELREELRERAKKSA